MSEIEEIYEKHKGKDWALAAMEEWADIQAKALQTRNAGLLENAKLWQGKVEELTEENERLREELESKEILLNACKDRIDENKTFWIKEASEQKTRKEEIQKTEQSMVTKRNEPH
jgi:predicted nuclease with TOPRIM domain